MSSTTPTSLSGAQLSTTRESPLESGPGLWIPFAAFFFIMLGIGWIPETLLKIPALYSISVGELLLAIAVLRNWRVAFGRLSQARLRTGLDVLVLVLLVAVGVNFVRNVAAGYPIAQVLRNSRRMFYYTFFFLLTAAVRDRESLVKVVRIFTTLFMVGAVSYFVTLLLHVPLASRIAVTDTPGGEAFERIYHVIFPMAVVVGLIHFALLTTGYRQRLGVSPWAAFVVATLLVYLSYYRNYYVSYLFGLLVVAVAGSRLRPRALVRAGGTLVLVAVVVLGGLAVTGVLGTTIERVGTLGAELADVGGTLASRLIIWGIRFDTIRDINPLLGAGFIWDQDPDRTAEDVILDPLVPDNDNGYAAALVLLGSVGVALFVLMYASAFWLAVKQLRRQQLAVERALSLAQLGLTWYVLLNSIGLDNFHWPYAVLPNLVLLAAVNAATLLNPAEMDRRGEVGPKPLGSDV